MNLVTCSILSNLSPNMFTGHGEAVFCITVISLILTTCINSSSLTHICMYLMLKIMLLCITNYNSIMPLVSWETSLLLQTPPSAVASLQTHSDTPRRSPPQFPSTSSRQCPARWVWWCWCSWAGWLRCCCKSTPWLCRRCWAGGSPPGRWGTRTWRGTPPFLWRRRRLMQRRLSWSLN